MLINTLSKMCELAYIASMRKGPLAFDEGINELGEIHNKKYLEAMIFLIIDGFDSETVEEMAIAKYFAEGIKNYDGLQYIMMLVGCLGIQKGEHPVSIEEKLLHFIPDNIVMLYKSRVAKGI